MKVIKVHTCIHSQMKHQESYQGNQYKSLPSIIVQERKVFSTRSDSCTATVPSASSVNSVDLRRNRAFRQQSLTKQSIHSIFALHGVMSIFCFHQVATGNTSGSDTTEYCMNALAVLFASTVALEGFLTKKCQKS